MTKAQKLQAISAILTIVAVKLRKLPELTRSDQTRWGDALARQIDGLASEIVEIAADIEN